MDDNKDSFLKNNDFGSIVSEDDDEYDFLSCKCSNKSRSSDSDGTFSGFKDTPSSNISISSDPTPNSEQNETNSGGALSNTDIAIPCVIGGSYPKEFLDMVSRVTGQYMLLPVLDYKSIYKELASLTVNSNSTPTFQTLNQELQKVQAAKERVCEIALDVIKNYSIKKRAVDILQDSWGNFSQEKSADKRKGDAIYRLSDFSMDFAHVEAALKVVSHVTKNLEGLQENLSKRLSSMQSQLRMHDIGVNTLPDMSFSTDADDWSTNGSSASSTPSATLSNEF